MTPGERFARVVFIGSLATLALGGAFVFGAIAQRDNLPPVPQLREARDLLRSGLIEGKSDIDEHLQPSRGQGEGVTVNQVDGSSVVLMVGFFEGETQARLVERDGSLRAKWTLNYFDHFTPDERICDFVHTPLQIDAHGALLTPEGDLVFNYEYCGTVKLDHCAEPIWTHADETHHSLIRAEAGGYWLLGRETWVPQETPDRFPPFSSAVWPVEIREDTILRLSDSGEVLDEFSIPTLLRDAGLEALLTANGDDFTRASGFRSELVHSNKVAELPSELAEAFPMFEAGDLAVSLRELNLVFVVDPDTRAVKWHQTGPWLRQHDPEFRADGRLSIFNNNVYRNVYPEDQTDLNAAFRTNILAIDPATRDVEITFGERPGQEMLSVIRGQHELLPDGGMVIAEFDAGRVLEVDQAGQIVWEYVNAYDASSVGEITNAAVYPKSYFSTLPGACS